MGLVVGLNNHGAANVELDLTRLAVEQEQQTSSVLMETLEVGPGRSRGEMDLGARRCQWSPAAEPDVHGRIHLNNDMSPMRQAGQC